MNWHQQLKDEFSAVEGSFLLELRSDLHWNRLSFERLIKAMEDYCKACANDPQLERWMAEGFYSLPGFVKDWSGHEFFSKTDLKHIITELTKFLMNWPTGTLQEIHWTMGGRICHYRSESSQPPLASALPPC